MSELLRFNYRETQVRTVSIQGEPWFVAKDVAEILGYQDSHNLKRMLDDDEMDTRSVSTLGGTDQLSIISEARHYRLVRVDLQAIPRTTPPRSRTQIHRIK